MEKNVEARLASALADELQTLQELESFKHADQAEVTLSLSDKSVTNHAAATKTLERRIEKLINNELVPIIETIVANQRERVSTARKALLDLMFNGSSDDGDAVKPETAAKVNGAFGDLEGADLHEGPGTAAFHPGEGLSAAAAPAVDGAEEPWLTLREGRILPTGTQLHRGNTKPEDLHDEEWVTLFDRTGQDWSMKAGHAYWGDESRLVWAYLATSKIAEQTAGAEILETEGAD